jgi:hypothetical protein
MNWPIADAPQFKRRFLATRWQRSMAGAAGVYVAFGLMRSFWNGWESGLMRLGLEMAVGLLALGIIFVYLRMRPNADKAWMPIPYAEVPPDLTATAPSAAVAPAEESEGGHPYLAKEGDRPGLQYLIDMDGQSLQGPPPNDLSRRALIDRMSSRIRDAMPAELAGTPLPVELQELLEREPFVVLRAMEQNLRPDDDAAYFLYSWATVPSCIKLDFLTFRDVFHSESVDASKETTAGAAAGVLHRMYLVLGMDTGWSLTIQATAYLSRERISDLLEVAYGAYVSLAHTLWATMSMRRRRTAAALGIYTSATQASMDVPLAELILQHPGRSAEILKYVERRYTFLRNLNLKWLHDHLERTARSRRMTATR